MNVNRTVSVMKRILATDDGRDIERSQIPVPKLCLSCGKNEECEVSCDLTRLDQMEEVGKGGMFCCFGYEPVDPKVDKDTVFGEMERYLSGKG
jgi:hypothetical protein